MADDGTILSLKSYKSVEGDMLEIEDMEFDGYEFYDISNDNAVFDENELNVILYYQKPRVNYWIYLIIAGAAILLLAGTAIIVRTSKKRKIDSIDIDE